MKRFCSLLLALIMLLAFASCSSNEAPKLPEDSAYTESDTQTDYVWIAVKDFGDIIVCLCPDKAPITVANFQKLVGEGFYNGLTFHRVYPGFMIQGGDPNGNGSGGSSETIVGEFSQNGYTNDLSHKRGVISMARSLDMNSASSQFFIMHKDNTGLDGSYAAFGYVVEGMEVVDAICEIDLAYNASDRANTTPVTPVVISSASFVKLK